MIEIIIALLVLGLVLYLISLVPIDSRVKLAILEQTILNGQDPLPALGIL
mgnify:CR=1 FL=1